jgi:1-acyl-sn-glycerol-3-phosphate acyltransferase
MRWYLGAEHIDQFHIPKTGSVILVSNHPTMCDPFVVAFGTKRWVTWMAWDEAFEWAGAGAICRLYKAIPINLENPKPSSIKAAYAVLARERVLGMFLEGERSFGDELNPTLKPGAARMAIRMGCPIVPATVSGLRRCWPREQSAPRPGKIVVRYHPPIDPTTFRPDLPHKERGRLITEKLGKIIGRALPPDGAARFF